MQTDAFIERVRQATQIASSDEDWSDSAVLAEAQQCIQERFSQPLVNARSGYWLYVQDSTTVPGQSFYRIPPRAIVQGLELFCTSLSANPGVSWYQLGVLTQSQSVDYLQQQWSGIPQMFAYEADGLVLYPQPQVAQPFQFRFYLRPAALVLPPGYGQLLSAVSKTQLIVNSPDAGPAPWTAGSKLDIRNLDGSCEAVAIDLTVASVVDGTNVLTLNLSTPLTDDQFSRLRSDSTQAVMTADTTWVVPLVAELCTSLASYTGAVILVDKGDSEKGAQLVSRCESSLRSAIDLMIPRVKDRPYVVVTRGTYLRRRVGFRRGWR
jgi:hypothetical protein